MTSNNKTLRVSLLASMIIAGLGVSSAASAAPPLKATPTVGKPAADLPTTRLIVGYHDQRLAPSVKLATVNAAARRARAGTMSAPAAAATASMVRKLAIGADLVRISRAMDKAELASLVKEIAADPTVKFVEVDRLLQHTGPDVQPNLVPDDGFYAQYQWHLKNTPGGTNAEPAWDIAQGNGVVVAVIDTGIVPHPDMDANMLPGYDFISLASISRRPTDGRAPGAYDFGDWTTAGDCGNAAAPARNSSFHGTHVAGTVAERTNNGIGMAGVAFNAKVLPIRALGRCGGFTSDIADAIVWASGGSVAGIPDNIYPAEVINLSLGGSGTCAAASQTAINIAVSRGTTVVVAAGNSNGDVANFSPASCSNVISVAAAGIAGGRASYSNYGPLIDLAAAGGGGNVDGANGFVWQAINTSPTSPDLGNPSYGGKAGTSMAAPHVAGVVALVQSAVDTPLTPAQMETLLKSSVRPFPATPDRVIGTGLLDAKLALDAALAPPGETPPTVLTSKVAVTGISGAAGSEKMYSIVVPAGTGLLNLMTYGGTGNVSLYVSKDAKPTTSAFGFRSARPGNNETVRISNPAAGTYFLLVKGETNYGGVSVQARVD